MMASWQDRSWRSTDGLLLHARDYPGAPGAARLPVICLHGLTRNARDFEAVAPWIAARERRVLAVDVRGRGGSDRDPARDYRLSTYAADVVQLARDLGLASALFVGTSMGGLITMELAAVAPALVAGAIVNDVGPELSQIGLKRIGNYVGNAAAFASWDEAAEHLQRQNAHALPHYRAAEWLGMARRMFREEGGRVAADYDAGIAGVRDGGPLLTDPWSRWRALANGRPLLLLRGTASDLLDRDVAERMVQDVPNARLVEVPGVGHAPMLDEPAALEAIGAFLATAP